jgi:LysM repeat protein
MRVTALAGLFACGVISMSTIPTASADALDLSKVNTIDLSIAEPVLLASIDTAPVERAAARTSADENSEEKKQPVKYKVVKGDSLFKIAEKHDTTWKRLFDKNTAIKDPDVIHVDDELVIPAEDEKLKERPLPAAAVAAVVPVAARQQVADRPAATRQAAPKPAAKPAPKRQAATAPRGSSSGNLYTPGYCTWYVKNRRPDLPNNLGNADTWVSRARAQGLPTGSTPRVGAVGQRGMHVVYVEKVHGNGYVTISER